MTSLQPMYYTKAKNQYEGKSRDLKVKIVRQEIIDMRFLGCPVVLGWFCCCFLAGKGRVALLKTFLPKPLPRFDIAVWVPSRHHTSLWGATWKGYLLSAFRRCKRVLSFCILHVQGPGRTEQSDGAVWQPGGLLSAQPQSRFLLEVLHRVKPACAGPGLQLPRTSAGEEQRHKRQTKPYSSLEQQSGRGSQQRCSSSSEMRATYICKAGGAATLMAVLLYQWPISSIIYLCLLVPWFQVSSLFPLASGLTVAASAGF